MKKINIIILLIFTINISHLISSDSTGIGISHSPNLIISRDYKNVKPGKLYFGAGYSFVFFTNNVMSNAYPAFDIITDNFVGEFGAFFGIRFTNFLSMDLEASYIFVQNNRNVSIGLNPQVTFPGNDSAYSYAQPQQLTMYAFPLVLNLKLFPFANSKSFSKHIFIGAGAGLIYIHENYNDVVYTINQNQVPYPYSGFPVYANIINSQWSQLYRISAGFDGSSPGKSLGFGAELNYNFVPLKKSSDPFITRSAQNFNSLDLTIKLYFNP